MNFCEERHEPKYQVTYKPAKGSPIAPVWMVCESCMANVQCFGNQDEIQTREILA